MRRDVSRIRIAALVLVACAIAGIALASGERAAKPAEIKIDNFSFVPAVLTIPRGTTVTWTNADDVPHVVRTEDGTIKSPTLDTDGKFSHTFDAKGTFPYFCSLHPMMRGKVVVE